MAVVVRLTLTVPASAYDHYVGYSGAPGSLGTCAYSCHGPMGGTIFVHGFPSTYQPGMTYTIKVGHSGGLTISNFNASVRAGTGPDIAGILTAGPFTSIYSVSRELSGVHLTQPNRDSGIFYWQAPNPAVGPVKLYFAGEQGTTKNGPNTEIVITATPAAAVQEAVSVRPQVSVKPTPTVVRTSTTIQVSLPAHQRGLLRVLDAHGRIAAKMDLPATADGQVAVAWRPYRADGTRLPCGSYFVLVKTGSERALCRITVN